MGGAFVAILASQQFTAFTLPTELYFFICIAVLAGTARKKDTILKTHIAMSRVRWWRWGMAIPLACFAVYLAAGDLLLAAARRAIEEENPERAAQYVSDARSWNASADIYFSQRFSKAKADQSAMDCALRATETADDRPNALVNLAAFQAGRDDAEGVEKSLRGAIDAAPNWFKPHWLLAQVLDREGRSIEAESEAEAAAKTAAGRDAGKASEMSRAIEEFRSKLQGREHDENRAVEGR